MPAISLRLAAAAAVAVLAACGPRQQVLVPADVTPARPLGATDAEKVLNVYNWSDYVAPGVIAEFEAAYGIKVNYDVFDSNEVLETKLLAGRTGYDLVVPSASFLERQVRAGVFRPLEPARLPNARHLDPDIARRVAAHDPGNRHAVTYFWGTSGVGYNVDKVAARMPGAPLDSLRMFWDPTVVARFADCGVTVLDAPSEVLGSVLVFLGRDPNSERPEDLRDAEAVLKSVRPYVRYVNSSRYIEDLANGEVCLSFGWVGDVFQARDRAAEAGNGVRVDYRIPREGAIIFFDVLAIPADARHPLNAHLFIDYLLRPDVAARNSDFVHYANANAASYSLMSPEVRGDAAIYPAADVMSRLRPDLAESGTFTRLLTRAWTRFRTGQ